MNLGINNIMKKSFILVLMFILLSINYASFVIADDFDETEEINEIDEVKENDNEISINQMKNELDSNNTINTSTNDRKVPILNSPRYVVYDRKSGLSILGKDENKQSSMASTTKIMTAVVVLEKCNNIEEIVTIDAKSAGIGGSTIGLKKGDKITINDLLYGLLMRSGNDTAIALATHIAGTVEKFAILMNDKANEIGLKNTHFVTPHGLDNPNHYTTAFELAKLTDYALHNNIISTIVKTKYATININGIKRELKNTNELLCSNCDGVYGVKTGFTNNAGRCLVTAIKRNNIDLIIVTLGANTRKQRASDTLKLIEYVYKIYRIDNLKEKIEEEFNNWKNINEDRIYVNKAGEKLELKIGEIDINEIVTCEEINIEINTINYLEAPVEKNKKIGTIVVKNGENIIEQVDILTLKTIKKLGIIDYFKKFSIICH